MDSTGRQAGHPRLGAARAWGSVTRLVGRFPNALSVQQLVTHDFRAQAEHDYRNVFLKSSRDVAAALPVPLADAAVLILGCGYTYPEVILFSDVAARVTGLDTLPAFYRDGPRAILRRRIDRNTVRQLVRATLFRPKYARYYRWLRRAAGVTIRHARYELHSYDGESFPFADACFDAVVSNATLEHLRDPAATFREVRRVTKPGGISYHLWHNYHSFSGGHVPDFLSRQHPWGHLRGQYATPDGVYPRTPAELEASFARCFQIAGSYAVDGQHRKQGVDADFTPEREDLLAGPVRDELRAYPAGLLLTKSYLLVGRKGDESARRSGGDACQRARRVPAVRTEAEGRCAS